VRGFINAQEVVSPEANVTIPAAAFGLESVGPNPATGPSLRVTLALPEAAPARLELLDVSGRLFESREVGSLGAGRHSIDLSCRVLRPGIHFVRLTQGIRSATRRVSMIR
jgi:hypothetical protein